MRKLYLLALLLCAIAFNLSAQNEYIYRFYYIAQSGLSDKSKICKELIKAYDDAKENDWNCVFYLANIDKPMIASTHDNVEVFNDIIAEMQDSNGHDVRPSKDAELIIDYLQSNPFFDEYGNVKRQYEKVYFYFYVNSEFWNNNGNRDLIAALYSALDIANQPNVQFDVLISKRDRDEGKMVYDAEYPFGKIAQSQMAEDFEIIKY